MCTVPFLFLHIGIGSGYLDQPTTNNLDAYEAQPLSLSCRHCGRSTLLALLQQGKVSTRRRPLVLENSGVPPPPARWVPTVLIAMPAEGEAALAWPSCPFSLAWSRRTVPRIRREDRRRAQFSSVPGPPRAPRQAGPRLPDVGCRSLAAVVSRYNVSAQRANAHGARA